MKSSGSFWELLPVRCQWLLPLIGAANGLVLIGFDLTGHLPPCGTGMCAQVMSLPLARPLGIGLPWWGLAYFSLAMVASTDLKQFQVESLRVRMPGLSSFAAGISIALVIYARMSTGGFCPYCLVSTFVTCTLATAWLVDSAPRRRRPKSGALVFGAFVALSFAFAFVRTTISHVPFHQPAALAKLTSQDLAPPSTFRIGKSQSEAETVVAFVEIQCGSCQAFLRRVIPLALSSKRAKLIVRFRRLAGEGPWRDFQESLYRAQSSEEAAQRLLKACEMGKPLPSTPSVEIPNWIWSDMAVAEAIGFKEVPFVIRVSPHAPPKVIPSSQAASLF